MAASQRAVCRCLRSASLYRAHGNETLEVIWVLLSYNLFYAFAFTVYTMSHSLMVPLSTRNTTQRGELSVFNQIATIMITGIVVALIFPLVIMPVIGVNRQAWIALMSIISGIALPLILLEYYFTKERITEESEGEDEKLPFLLQLKALLSDKYYILLILYFLFYIVGTTFKNIGLVYYCNYVLGTYNDGITQMMVSTIGGLPMGFGIFLVWPLAKRFGKRNLTMFGFLIYAFGSLICWLFPTDFTIVLIGQFIKNFGSLPCAYVFMALFADCLDHMEWKTGFRSDGVAMSIYSIITVAIGGICTGIFNYFLSKNGYIAPFTLEQFAGGTAPARTQMTAEQISALTDMTHPIAFIQPTSVNSLITFAFVGLEVITGLACAACLFFIDVEKTIDRKQAVLVEREKETYEKQGKTWLPADERNAIAMKEQEEQAEAAFRAELKENCLKTGKDFDAELKKHEESVAAKKAKEAEKKAAAEAKNAANEQLKKEKAERKLAALTPEKSESIARKEKEKADKTAAFWAKEKAYGERQYAYYKGLLGGTR
ncbi:MAG: MFS transporter [Lachnospiraceae bacterium]|nr:MFS transporter [Lachnospiraceae bacterium]